MPKFSANLGFLWQELGLCDAVQAAAEALGNLHPDLKSIGVRNIGECSADVRTIAGCYENAENRPAERCGDPGLGDCQLHLANRTQAALYALREGLAASHVA